MEGAVTLVGGLVLMVGIFVLYDWLTRRKDRRARQHFHAPQ